MSNATQTPPVRVVYNENMNFKFWIKLQLIKMIIWKKIKSIVVRFFEVQALTFSITSLNFQYIEYRINKIIEHLRTETTK